METAFFVIRPATEQDDAGILDCLRRAFARYESDYSPDAFRDTVLSPEALRERRQVMDVLVAVTEQNLVAGTLAYDVTPNGGHLRGLAVLPEWQGHGVARRLLGRAERLLIARGCEHVTLDTTAPLEQAAEFYRRRGYHRTGRVRDFFGMPLTEWAKGLTTTRQAS